MWVRSLGGEDLLEKVMATHSSNLAERMPWTEEPGRLQFMGCKESDITEATLHTHTHMQTFHLYYKNFLSVESYGICDVLIWFGLMSSGFIHVIA